MYDNNNQQNGVNHFFAMPQWPIRKDISGLYNGDPTLNALDPNSDPYLFNVPTTFDTTSRVTGWDYEPGSISGHDMYSGPGGPRFDRNVFPTALAMDLSFPGGSRLKDGVLYSTIADAFGKSYFNHCFHMMTDVKTFAPTNDALTLAGTYAHSGSYYATNDYGYSSLNNGGTANVAVHLRAHQLGGHTYDKHERFVWNGWAIDPLHNYTNPGLWALIYNSPMHLISAKHRYHHGIMSQALQTLPGDPHIEVFTRAMAWRLMHQVMAWKLATDHPLGLTRSEVETRFQADLESIYDQVYVPAVVNNDPSYKWAALRNLGMIGYQNSGFHSGVFNYCVLSNSLVYYIGNVFMLMKQTGSWNAMMAKSTKCQLILTFIVQCLDKYSIDFILDTTGHGEGYYPSNPLDTTGNNSDPSTNYATNTYNNNYYTAISTVVSNGQTPVLATSWANWQTLFPPVGQADWIHKSDGSINIAPERDATQHMRAQWAFIRRDFFPEIPNSRINAACAKYQSYYDTVANNAAAQATPFNQAAADWALRIPSMGFYKVPTVN
jgi:hypothetical protein